MILACGRPILASLDPQDLNGFDENLAVIPSIPACGCLPWIANSVTHALN